MLQHISKNNMTFWAVFQCIRQLPIPDNDPRKVEKNVYFFNGFIVHPTYTKYLIIC